MLGWAIGPLPLAECLNGAGSYAAIFCLLAAIVGVLGAGAWFAPIPSPKQVIRAAQSHM